MILDCEVYFEVSIILGRSFITTGRALVDVESRNLTFWVTEKEVTFNVCKSMKQPNDLHVFSFIDVVASVNDVMSLGELLAGVLLNYDNEEIENYDEIVVVLSSMGSYFRTPPKLDLDLKNWKSPPTKPSIEDPPKLELKVIPL